MHLGLFYVFARSFVTLMLSQVISCKDTIAQQYLMECIIQVFPDEFHLRTLQDLLAACAQLQAGVDCKAMLVALMNRLAAFAKAEPQSIPSDVDMLAIFHTHVSSLETTNLELSAILDLQVGLVNLALGFAPDRLEFVDQTLASVAQRLVQANMTTVTGKARDALVLLLKTPLLSNGKPLEILALPNYASLMPFLPLDSRREVAVVAGRLMTSSKQSVSSPQDCDALLNFLQPLVKDVVEDTVCWCGVLVWCACVVCLCGVFVWCVCVVCVCGGGGPHLCAACYT
jgi:vacuolar protein sorting-associated protein 35